MELLEKIQAGSPEDGLLGAVGIAPELEEVAEKAMEAYGEVFYGIMKSSNMLRLLKLFEAVLLPRVTILPFDFLAGKKYGEIRSLLEKQGTPLEHADLQIASIALSRNMILITGNIRHFKRVPDLRAR